MVLLFGDETQTDEPGFVRGAVCRVEAPRSVQGI